MIMENKVSLWLGNYINAEELEYSERDLIGTGMDFIGTVDMAML